ncbi:MAG: hypothetical protein HC870_03235 [Rhizobiales bacterium]|nr:hypothetical protein [Hyphomicrobiales bacterium]
MRRQVAPLAESHADIADDQLEDLGWNDMGDHEPGAGADIVPINAGLDADDFGGEAGPVVRRQQRRLEERLLADAVMTGPEDREPEYDDEDEPFYGEDAAETEDYAPVYARAEEEEFEGELEDEFEEVGGGCRGGSANRSHPRPAATDRRSRRFQTACARCAIGSPRRLYAAA